MITEELGCLLEGYITTQEASEILNCSINAIRLLLWRNRFKGAIKVNRNWLIPRESVESFTKQKTGPKKAQRDDEFLLELFAQNEVVIGNRPVTGQEPSVIGVTGEGASTSCENVSVSVANGADGDAE